jgi:hypothetical protein
MKQQAYSWHWWFAAGYITHILPTYYCWHRLLRRHPTHTKIHSKHVRIICPYQERHGVPSAMEIRDEVGIYSLIGCKRMEKERVSSVYGRCNMRPKRCVCVGVSPHPSISISTTSRGAASHPARSTPERAVPSARLAARRQKPTCLQRRPTSSAPKSALFHRRHYNVIGLIPECPFFNVWIHMRVDGGPKSNVLYTSFFKKHLCCKIMSNDVQWFFTLNI